ncbi:unnamed protein product [Lactuca saligna]|uniref:Transposase MuDR plant domain-containing protein n=1 Tax=Lactuca saligna TaxID=75948 RepID=A0AA36EEG7_LACSI|nr:unnamed protein product [Lactuca saligna]
MSLLEESKVSLAYQHSEQLYYCGIVDDRDIRKLIKVINVVGDKSVFVYVVVEEGVSLNEVDDRGKAYAANLSSGKGSNNPIALDAANKVGNEYGKQEVSFLHDGELKGYSEFVDCDKLDISDLESDSNREEFDDEPKLIYLDTMFHGMPQLHSCHVNYDVNIPCQRVDINEEIKVLDIFGDKELLKLAIGRQCMEQGNQYKTTRSSKEMFDVVCLLENCSWMIKARGIKSNTVFQVTKVVDQHTCCATNLDANHRQSKKKVLNLFIAEVLAGDYNRVYRGMAGKTICVVDVKRYQRGFIHQTFNVSAQLG